jgi:hypothetical protein
VTPQFFYTEIMTSAEKNSDRGCFHMPSATDIQMVITIVTDATNAKRPSLATSPVERRLEIMQQWFLSHAIHAAVVMLVTAGLAVYTKSRPLADTTLALVLISQFLVIAMLIPMIVSGTIFLLRIRRAPYDPFFQLVQSSAHLDLARADALAKCPKQAVQYVLAYFKYERNGYEKRAGLLVGAIDKVGIMPALAGLVLLVSNLGRVPGATGWAGIFGPLLLAFYFMALASAGMTQKMDRVIALLEYSVQSRK